jgi:hypothetical protein
VAVKNQRIRVYMLTDVGTDGRKDERYALLPSDDSDGGFWGAVSFISQREGLIGAQAQRTVIYDVTTGTEVPYTLPSCDGYITVLPEEVQILRIMAVAEIYNTRERQARCLEASDTGVTLTE